MIVFYLCISIVLVVITLLASSIIVDIKKLDIRNIENLKNIYLSIEDERYDKAFDYIKIELNINIVLFNILPISVLKVNDKKMKDIIQKIMIKDLKEMRQNERKFKIKRAKQKEEIKKIQKRINPKIRIEDADLKLNIGLTNAGVTALATGILNILISILILELVNENINKKTISEHSTQKLNNIPKFNYEVKPIYSQNFEFNLKTKLKLHLPISSLI